MQISDILATLLTNRGLTDPQKIYEFLHPPHPMDIPAADLGWDNDQLKTALELVHYHLQNNHPIAVYGDYDVDGITSTAILWETFYAFSKSVFPHIPHRREEGYGLTTKGIDHCLSKGAKLIITADSGITAAEEIAYCRSHDCAVIVIDHHQPPAKLPEPNALLFSTSTSAAGLSWFFAKEFLQKNPSSKTDLEDLLSLAAVAVICDLVPLLGISRSIAKFGLISLNKTTRPGLLALFSKAGIKLGEIDTYHAGFIIGPRLNAMGRLEHALDSLRLLCTTDPMRALELAELLDNTNHSRQDLTLTSTKNALSRFSDSDVPAVIIAADVSYDEGVIGLVAAKLVEQFYRPSLVIAIGPEISKGSARSVSGFHLTDFLKNHSRFLSSVGGHHMAAGFSLATRDLDNFVAEIQTASKEIDTSAFVRLRKIDVDIPISLVSHELYNEIDQFAPFGLGNPRPVFASDHVVVSSSKRVGKDFSHLKFTASGFDAIYFQAPPDLHLSDQIEKIVYSLDINTYNGLSKLQLLVKDIYGSSA